MAPAASRCHGVWLVRHGESTWNALGLVQGQEPLPGLTARGVRQAREATRLLARQPVCAIYSSDLRRATQTAVAVASTVQVDVVEDRRLRERSFGTAEGTPVASLSACATGIVGGVVVDADAAAVGGESVRDLYRRAGRFMAELLGQAPTGDVALVCHGGVVRVILAWLDGQGPDGMAWPPIANGAVRGRLVTLPERTPARN